MLEVILTVCMLIIIYVPLIPPNVGPREKIKFCSVLLEVYRALLPHNAVAFTFALMVCAVTNL